MVPYVLHVFRLVRMYVQLFSLCLASKSLLQVVFFLNFVEQQELTTWSLIISFLSVNSHEIANFGSLTT